ncbi:MAG TPA: S53 family peptidase [Actinophytocola sp.]|jgi:subtilase family serine protease|uniref:S53 family peptidase n=1 Tax=Actinophytocola sp. TaxID=1872138 RepID=UPI002F95F73A
MVFASLAAVGGLAWAVPAIASTDGRATIPRSHSDWATAHSKVADTDPQSRLSFRVFLKMRDQAGAEALAKAVSDPQSPSFRKFLSPAQVRDRFAPTQQAVGSVRQWLSGEGFRIGDVPANRAYITASGTADQVQQAFGVELGQYKVGGKTLRAADKNLSIPSNLAGDVFGVSGVDQSTAMVRPNHETGTSGKPAPAATAHSKAKPGDVPPGPGFRNAGPCSAYYGEKTDTTDPAFDGKQRPYAPCGYKPDQLRSAYGIDGTVQSGVDGRGTTVAILDAFGSPTIVNDATTYAKRNDPRHPLRQAQFSQKVYPPTPELEPPDQCDAAGWYGEETLDVEAVHAMAPGANIYFVGASDCLDSSIDVALNDIVANRSADMVSNSYGDAGEDIPAEEVQAFTQIATQAALEGIGLYFSSGDSGDEAANLGQPSPDFSASSPWVTAVGGTSMAVDATGKRQFETGWETGKSTLTDGGYPEPAFNGGAGGGTSRLFREPFYQKGIVPDALARQNQTGGNRGRVVPDVSALADPNTGFLIGQTQTFSDGVYYDQFRIGGTSLACPLMAGIVAVADDLDDVHHGFINPVIYQITSHTGSINDVKHVDAAVERVDFANSENADDGLIVSARTLDYGGLTIHTKRGYDNVTGVGSPGGRSFLRLL